MTLTVPISTDSEQSYGTPGYIYDHYAARYTYVIDLAANWKNTKCPIFLDEAVNSLTRDWIADMARAAQMLGKEADEIAGWLNPPFAAAGTWARYMLEQARRLASGQTLTMLCLANSIGTEWYKKVAPFCETEIITPRFSYVHPDPAAAAAKWAARKAGRDPAKWKPAAPSSSMVLIFQPRTVEDPTRLAHQRLRIRHVDIRNPQGAS